MLIAFCFRMDFRGFLNVVCCISLIFDLCCGCVLLLCLLLRFLLCFTWVLVWFGLFVVRFLFCLIYLLILLFGFADFRFVCFGF